MLKTVEMCPHCGELVTCGNDGLTPYHDYPKPARAICPGSQQIPRNAISDRRALWNGQPNPHAVRADVTPEQIVEQRAKGWPNFHPEDFCHRCGRSNIVWFTNSEFWNVAVPKVTEILCPQCFVTAHEDATGRSHAWELIPDALTTPWGRQCIQRAEARVAELEAELAAERAKKPERLFWEPPPIGDGVAQND